MVNVTMLVRDRPMHTRQSLESLYKNTAEDQFNLTVIDDESKPETEYCLKARSKEWGFTLVRINKSQGTGWARNLSAAVSAMTYGCDSWLYMSDNDVFFKEGWLDRLTECMKFAELHDFALLGGWNHPYHHPNNEFKESGCTLWDQYAVAGASWLMRWDTWYRFGPLKKTTPGMVRDSEDSEFCNKIRETRLRVGCVWPHVVEHTGATDTFGQKPPGWEMFKSEAGAVVE